MTEETGGAGGAPVPRYCLISFDKRGQETPPAQVRASASPDPKLGAARRKATLVTTEIVGRIIQAATANDAPITDVFIVSHGWLADFDGAVASYNEWLAVAKQQMPLTMTSEVFRPLVIAIHWPSKPPPFWRHSAPGVPFATHPEALPHDGGRTLDDPPQPRLPRRFWSGIMSVVPWISFFRMKARAETVGLTGVAKFIAVIQHVDGEHRIHVVGHSFGAKVVAEAISVNGDPKAKRKEKRETVVAPVASMFLLEGALSTWAFAGNGQGAEADQGTGIGRGKNPYGTTDDGSVAAIFAPKGPKSPMGPKVLGVAVAGTSRWDYALHRVFPGAEYLDMLSKRLRHRHWPFRRTTMPDDKKVASLVGAVGAWGFSFAPAAQKVEHMNYAGCATPTQIYDFRPYSQGAPPYRLVMDDVVDLKSTVNIVTGEQQHWSGILSGAHSNIARPEVAHAYWEVVTVSRLAPRTPISWP